MNSVWQQIFIVIPKEGTDNYFYVHTSSFIIKLIFFLNKSLIIFISFYFQIVQERPLQMSYVLHIDGVLNVLYLFSLH